MNQTIDLNEYETQLVVRPMKIDDFERLVEMQRKCFPAMQPWGRDQIESQLERFPEGQVVVEIDGVVVASSSSLRLNYDDHQEWHDWKKSADGGYIRNHQPDGDVLYGIEIMVDPDYRGMRLSRRLYDARKEYCVVHNIRRMIVGGRLPGYHKHADAMKASEYVDRVMNKAIYDPVLTAQIANGFSLQGLIPNYLPSDVESCGYATYLEWRNLDFMPKSKRTLRRIVDSVRIGAVQYEMRAIDDFDDLAKQVKYFVDVAGDYKCDFVLFPELFSVQLLSTLPNMRPGEGARRLAEFTPQLLELLAELAVAYDVNLIGGSHLVVENERLFNVAYLCHRDGRIDKQYKLHITPAERRWWGVEPGDRLDVFDTDCGKISIQICYDVEFPELSRLAVQQGANLIFVPFNTDTRNGYLRVRHCAAARCIENEVYVAIAGCTGNLPFVENADIHYAQSSILTPCDVTFARDGIGAQANENIESVVIHDVDLELLRRHRVSGSVRNWNDRRTDLYEVIEKQPRG
ncbi:bifunctional GNAT family N-acetyltransferase/carbon-nitrogen hydrolase family protein [Roseiconus lacunae]|uniref:Bifunctional GNAT family N-acetyltransferase/carbon-nitrogen hydrolase family protein n=1 Tax=Roseiconus lacunae TaxID=2605694 RepID=A0ABT7PER8_9BACT|nr:bifunctional GNAT family N-acetyltransferase/carbon-nitrogen hydrolase family protein [Roseiconus lacunae]MDM4014990.1 bifunctional GNAT family N-acetyltransferase/carbon-nitrogen hydrolase family protein [Roseiconus lacunae]WRQ50234.1 bifunctional GNAT family N-acetyltransferase/carbon-nitrogen hydrolase family protein [Stieleria sp. HD01]